MPEFNIIAEYIPSSNLTAQFIPVNFNVPPVLASKTITANGLYEASADNVTGYSSVTVAVPDRPTHNGELNVTPTTEAQTIDVPSYLDGYGPVNVAAVTSAIDSNIQPENIRENVTILGTTGTAYVPEYFVDFSVSRETLTKKAKMINLSGVTAIGARALLYEYNGMAFPAHTHIDMSNITSISSSACNGMFALTTGVESVDLSGLKNINGYGCDAMFKHNTDIVSVDLSSLSKITYHNVTYEMFYGCTHLTTVNLSSLQIINAMYAAQYMFYGCTALTTIDLSSLVVAWNTSSVAQFFKGCSSLTNVDLSRLTTIGNASQMFADCTSLVRMDFPSLMHTNYISSCSQMFMNCTSLQTLTFPALYSGSFSGYNRTDQWYRLLQGVTGCTIHLPKNLDPQTGSTVLSSLQGYPNFGGTDTVLAYDLPSTFVLTGADTVEYERNPKYDTSTALAWRVKFTGSITDIDIDWTPFYTSGTADPQVGATIYSDASCTTAVTTISTIA